MSELKNFLSRFSDFFLLDSGNQIKYFVYYLLTENHLEAAKAKDISLCFEVLHLNAYSNIPAYLNNYSKKGKSQQFLKKKNGYVLLSNLRDRIDKEFGNPITLMPTNALYPLTIFDNTRGYLVDFSKEASSCYDYGLYTSCLFMLRKITETLIIELYESKGIQSKIKNPKGDYLQLSDLISSATSEPNWKLTKIVKENLPKIKLLADSSVHSKRFSAKQADIDSVKTNVRITFEEFISHIDYPSWNKGH
jgi:hypothetical protein